MYLTDGIATIKQILEKKYREARDESTRIFREANGSNEEHKIAWSKMNTLSEVLEEIEQVLESVDRNKDFVYGEFKRALNSLETDSPAVGVWRSLSIAAGMELKELYDYENSLEAIPHSVQVRKVAGGEPIETPVMFNAPKNMGRGKKLEIAQRLLLDKTDKYQYGDEIVLTPLGTS